MHPTLLKISQENDKVFLKILSKNSELKYLEVKHRKDPTQFIVLDIKKHRFKSENILFNLQQRIYLMEN